MSAYRISEREFAEYGEWMSKEKRKVQRAAMLDGLVLGFLSVFAISCFVIATCSPRSIADEAALRDARDRIAASEQATRDANDRARRVRVACEIEAMRWGDPDYAFGGCWPDGDAGAP